MEVHDEIHDISAAIDDISLAIASEVNIVISGGDAAARTALAWLIHQSQDSAGSFIVLSAPAERDPAGAQAMIRGSNGGTLFIEELADLDIDTLHELLRVVDARGPDANVAAPRRVIAAMGDDLQDRIASDPILGNLFYRLNSIHLVVQPLVLPAKTWLM